MRPIHIGDTLVIRNNNGTVKFLVSETDPAPYCMVSSTTEIDASCQPVREDAKTSTGDAAPSIIYIVKEITDEDSFVIISKEGFDELHLRNGDTVLLKSEKGREICSYISCEESVPEKNIMINQVICNYLAVQTGCRVMLKPCERRETSNVISTPICEAPEKIKGSPQRNQQDSSGFEEEAQLPSLFSSITTLSADNVILEFKKEKIFYKNIGGYKDQLNQIKRSADLQLSRPELFEELGDKPCNGILLTGPTGIGKSMIAQAVANETNSQFLVINGSAIVRENVGETEELLREQFAKARKKTPAVIFIDQLDVIAPKRQEAAPNAYRSVAPLLAALMDSARQQDRLVVIAATNQSEVDPELRGCGRFEIEIKFSIPSPDDRLEILNLCSSKIKLAPGVDLKTIANEAHGFVGADLASLCSHAARRQIEEKEHSASSAENVNQPEMRMSLAVTQENFLAALKEIQPSSLRGNTVEIPKVSWEDVGGLEDIKQELIELIVHPLKHPEVYIKFGIMPSRGVLFFGPPGCGKTLLAKAIANECQANFISIKGPEIFGKWVGESEANIRGLFDKARRAAPCVLFFDEMDSVGRVRGDGSAEDGGSHVADRVVNQLLVEIDGVTVNHNVFVVGATNRPDLIEPALLRPGRLDQLIYIPIPDEKSRLAILKATLRNSPHTEDIKTNMLHEITEKTEGYSGADLAGLCQRACKLAIREAIEAKIKLEIEHAANPDTPINDKEDPVPEIRRDHFEEAIKTSRKSVTQADVNKFQEFATRHQINLLPTIRTPPSTSDQPNPGVRLPTPAPLESDNSLTDSFDSPVTTPLATEMKACLP